MGYYIELEVKVKLRKDLPQETKDFLDRVVNKLDIGVEGLFHEDSVPAPDMDHPFFKDPTWYKALLFTDFGDTKGSSYLNDTLSIHTSSKCSYEAVWSLAEWIETIAAGRDLNKYIGWYQGDNDEGRENLYIRVKK